MRTRSARPPLIALLAVSSLLLSSCDGSWWDIFGGGSGGGPTTTMPSEPTDPPTPTTEMPGDDTTTSTMEPEVPTTPTTEMPGDDTTTSTTEMPTEPTGADGHPEGWNLIFSDEFDGDSLDRSKWCTRYVYGGGPSLQPGYEDDECLRPGGLGTLHTLSGNAEGQIYLDENQMGQELHVVGDGHLELNATHTAASSEHQYGIEYECR